MIAPLLSSLLLLADPVTGGSLPAPPITPVRLDDDEDDRPPHRLDPDEDVAPNSPDSRGVAFLKAAGASCLTTSGLCVLGLLVCFIPAVGPALGLIVHLLNPWVATAAGWMTLNGLADWRAPLLSMLVGAVLPFYVALGAQLVVGVVIGVLGVFAAFALNFTALGLFVVTGGSSGQAGLGTLLAYAGALVFIALGVVAAVTLLDALFVGGAVAVTSLLSSGLGVALGRGLGIDEESFPFDLIKSPSLRVDGEPRRPHRRPPLEDHPRDDDGVHPSPPEPPSEPAAPPSEPAPEEKPPPTSF